LRNHRRARIAADLGDLDGGSVASTACAGGPLDRPVTDQPSRNRERNLKITRNEAANETRRNMRLTAWAVSLALAIALIGAFVLLTR
jgi:hypothetical protein